MPNRRCGAKTVAGRRCKCYVHKEGFCWIHCEKPECSICMEEVNEKIKLDCGHNFCKECIYPWIVEKWKDSSCPMCRTAINWNVFNKAIVWAYDTRKVFDAYSFTYDMSVLEESEIYYLAAFHNITRYSFIYGDEFDNFKSNLDIKDPQGAYIFDKLLSKIVIKKSPFYNNGKIFSQVHQFF